MTIPLDRIMGQIGLTEEAAHYLHRFRQLPPQQFAVVKVSGECLVDSLEEIAEDLAYLYHQGLIPTVIYGWGKELTRRLNEANIWTGFDEDGDRKTTAKAMEALVDLSRELSGSLLHKINQWHAQAVVLDPGSVFKAEQKYGLGKVGTHTGALKEVIPDEIKKAIERGFIPIVSPIASAVYGSKPYNVNADTAASRVVLELNPSKYIMLTSTGGILNADGEMIREVMLRTDYRSLMRSGTVSEGMRKKLQEASELLNVWGEDHSIQLASPISLLGELLTMKGRGTRIRQGYTVERKDLGEVDANMLKGIINRSFREYGLRLVDDYFTDLARQEVDVYLEQAGKGVAIIIKNPTQGIGAHLEIFAIPEDYRRNGLARDLFRAILDEKNIFGSRPLNEIDGYGNIAWRSQTDRPINAWYSLLARMTDKLNGSSYMGYFIGKREDFVRAMNYLEAKPPNFVSIS